MIGSNLKDRLAAVNAELDEKKSTCQAKWAAFDDARKTVKAKGYNTPGPAVNAAEALHSEYLAVAADVKSLEDTRDSIFRQMAAGGQTKTGVIRGQGGLEGSPGERATRSYELKQVADSGALDSDRMHFQAKLADISRAEMKSLITGASDTSAGSFVDAQRVGYVQQPQRPASILNLITVGETNSDQVKFTRQTTFTNVAAEIAEATSSATGTKPEATLDFETITADAKTIAHWVPATRRALSDAGQLQMIIDQQLRYGLQLRLENQLVNGDGTGENLTGVLNTSGILTQAKGADTVVEAVHKAATQIRLGYVEPNAVLLHPSDWEVVRLAKTTDGDYYYGPPSQAGAQTLWGMQVIVSSAIPDDTALVGDFRQMALWVRESAQVIASDSHDDYFVKNQIAILCEGRFAAGVLLPAAFCKVTSVDA